MTRSLLVQRILLSVRKEAKTSLDIGAEINVNEPYIQDELDWLARCQLVQIVGENRYIANLIVLDREEKEPLVDLAKRLCREEAIVIREQLPGIENAFKRCSFEDQGYSWDQMNHVVLGGLIGDLGVNISLKEHGMVPSPPKRIDGGNWYYWGLEGGSSSKRQFGTNFDGDEKGGTGHVWSDLVEQPTINPLEKTERTIMLALINGPLSVKKISEMTGIATNEVTETLKELCTFNYFIKDEGKYLINFPVFMPNDLEIMLGEVRRVSNLVVDNVFEPRRSEFRRLYEEMGLNQLGREYGAYLCMFYHIVMDHTLDQLIDNLLLAELPIQAKATWGFWGWVGQWQLNW